MEEVDAIVIGGGPAGSAAATFIAMQGHRVLLLERESFPVYKIGESLLPSTVHGVCAMLGVSQELKEAGFVHKLGGTFRWGKSKSPWTFAFGQSSKFPAPTAYAYQVERMKFDSILLNNARRKGVAVREKHWVTGLIVEQERVTGVEFVDDNGQRRTVRSKYVVDASGHTSAVARHAGRRVYSQFFRNVAVFGYFRNGKRLPAPCAGNIFCATFEKGWFWYIPLSPTLTSVGAVIGQEYSGVLQKGLAKALSEFIASCDPIRELLSESNRVTEGPYGEVRVRKDYSYCHTKFWHPGLVLVGDAACFVDPVFSSGVHLATYSALLAARSINTSLRSTLGEEEVFTEFEKRYRREYRYFYDFLVSFYDMDQDLDSYYWAARKVLKTPEGGNDAFIRLVGGIAASGEPLYSNSDEFVREHENLAGQLFSKPAFVGTSLDMGPANSVFMARLTAEAAHLQLRAALPNVPLHENPLFDDGLVPSVDGLHWVFPARRGASANSTITRATHDRREF
jgi:halogenation protein CepH